MGNITMALVLTTGLLLPLPVGAAQVAGPGRPAPSAPEDARTWGLWLGCWDRQVQGDAQAPGVRVCVERQGDRIAFRTLAEGSTVLEEFLPTDRQPHAIETPGCEGAQVASWAGGRVLLTRSEVACAGQPRQVVSRIGTLRTLTEWLDVVVVEARGRETVYIRKYQRVGDPAVSVQQPMNAAVTLSLDGLGYALSIVSPRAVEALLAETRPVYKLSGKTLVGLKDAGVPPGLIDLVIALSLPERFRVSGAGGGSGFGGFPIGIFPGAPYAAEWGMPLWAFDDDYWYWGNCGFWDCLGPGIPVDPGGPGDGGEPGAPREHGRVVNGLGYARVWPREADTRGGGGHGGSTQGESAGITGSTDTSAGSGTVSPQGYSGGSGTDTGRTAEPRTSPPPQQP